MTSCGDKPRQLQGKLYPVNTFPTSVSTLEALLGRYGHFFCETLSKKVLKIAIFTHFKQYIGKCCEIWPFSSFLRYILNFSFFFGFLEATSPFKAPNMAKSDKKNRVFSKNHNIRLRAIAKRFKEKLQTSKLHLPLKYYSRRANIFC